MNFCGNCGAPATGTAYCTNCGQPMTTAAGQQPAASPGSTTGPPAAGQTAGAQHTPTRAGGGTPAVTPAPVRSVNPFAAVPVGDYVRDAVALLLLLVPLGMAWDLEDKATDKVYVILVTLLSIISLALPYLKATSVLPPNLTPAQLRVVRLAANAPYLIVVLVTLVLGYLGELSDGRFDYGDGVGVGLVLGLAGALLAAQGRASEQDAAGDGNLWRSIVLTLAGLGVVTGVVSGIIVLIDMGDVLDWSQLVVLLLTIVFFIGVPLVPVLGMARGDAAWRDVAVALGVVGIMVSFWAMGAEETIGEAWSLRLPLPLSGAGDVGALNGPQYLFWPAIGAAGAAAGIAARARQAAGAQRWVMVTRRVLETAGLLAVLAVVILAIRLVDNEDARGPIITVLVVTLIALAATLVGRNALVSDARAGRSVAMGVAGVFVVIGIVIASLLGTADTTQVDASAATFISALFIFAVVIVLALTAPPSVRAELGQFTLAQGAGAGDAVSQSQSGRNGGASTTAGSARPPAGHAAPQPGSGQVGAAASAEQSGGAPPDGEEAALVGGVHADDDSTRVLPESGPPATEPTADPAAAEEPTAVPVTDQPAAPTQESASASGYTVEMAADPSTPLQTLADIAAAEPSLRPNIAMNPSTYPELLDWLGQLGDPAVDEALRQRRGS